MKIIIEGNMASGKSTYAKALAAVYKIPHISMDKARREIFTMMDVKTKERETMARNLLAGKIQSLDSFILERIGSGEFDQRMDKYLGGSIRILIQCKPLNCIMRFESRQAHHPGRIPLPDWMSDHETFIRQTDEKLQEKMERHQYLIEMDNNQRKGLKDFKSEIRDLMDVINSLKN